MSNAVFVTQQEFDDLPTYQLSEPTGVYHNGKLMKWKRQVSWTIWTLVEYVEIGKKDKAGICCTPMVVYDPDWGVE